MRLQVVETEPAPFRFEPLLYGPTAIKQYAFIRDLAGYSEAGYHASAEAAIPASNSSSLARSARTGASCSAARWTFLARRSSDGGWARIDAGGHGGADAGDRRSRDRAHLGRAPPANADALPILGPVPGLEGLVLNAGHVFGNLAGPISGQHGRAEACRREDGVRSGVFAFDRPGLRANNEQHRRWWRLSHDAPHRLHQPLRNAKPTTA